MLWSGSWVRWIGGVDDDPRAPGSERASGGTGTVLGEPIEHPERFADRVGALIESPALVGSLSGRDNLRSLAALRGLPGKRIDEVLEIVGLVGREGDKASTIRWE